MIKSLLIALFITTIYSLNFYHDATNHDQLFVLTKSSRYYYNESQLKGQCSLNAMCDGKRKCSHQGKCVGHDRPAKSADYFCDETITKSKCPVAGDFNFAIADYFCNGKRTCKQGMCEGSQR